MLKFKPYTTYTSLQSHKAVEKSNFLVKVKKDTAVYAKHVYFITLQGIKIDWVFSIDLELLNLANNTVVYYK